MQHVPEPAYSRDMKSIFPSNFSLQLKEKLRVHHQTCHEVYASTLHADRAHLLAKGRKVCPCNLQKSLQDRGHGSSAKEDLDSGGKSRNRETPRDRVEVKARYYLIKKRLLHFLKAFLDF